MLDATANPRSLLLLGGTSDIALAIARAYAKESPALDVVLAARPSPGRSAAADALRAEGVRVREVDLDARATDTHAATIDAAFAEGDVDMAVVAFGILGEAERAWQEPAHALEMAEVNFTAPVHLGVMLADRLRAQGHGQIVVLSSVAGERIRRSNFVYGATKAGLDGFYRGLSEALRGSGVNVMVVRPGFVKSKMTEGLRTAPLAVVPDQVAVEVVEGVRLHRSVVWAPKLFRLVMLVLRLVPQPIFRRLPF
ncbi:decaprenylphospho-beta-D-erythro-pentofuranosid-2-ulose 2-reductase [Raineyella antarctica]|uniref:Decaprenylphospho-beta-D-erythro-pentofuranosid-2-ulose 2-reductase n=1 Tax=Raineyella antarctica TaxID=1577474 RepID=A0A1G6H4B8_9ACTN|nr:decaprenylphospho-beta-D-erythro-pentofuranosid-2-ulose 2-reductase [Raineyella antarctica]SDB89140.1 decaprenylphospho-beta-D-erythro-pentofuranosid-2-ulose 2-reductase [Raineyella antarctica]